MAAGNRGSWIIAAVAFAVFLPSVFCGFVFDDLSLISENQYAQDLDYLGRAFTTHLWDIYRTGTSGDGRRYYRPLIAASYVLNWALSEGKPWSFHLVNVALHAATTVLAARIARRWTGHAALGVVAGLVFALHPSRTESVSWVSGRTDLMMALFMLVAVECAQRASVASATRRVLGWSGAVVLVTVLGILSKENAIATGLLIAVDAALAQGRARQRLVKLAVVTGALGSAYLVGRVLFYPVVPGAPATVVMVDYGLMTCWAYVERVLVPWPQTFFHRTLVADPGQRLIPLHLVALGGLVVLGYLALLVRAWRRDRPALWMLLATLVLFGPLLNFTDAGIGVTTSDRFLYLPLLPLTCALCRLASGPLSRALESRSAVLAGAGVALIWVAIVQVRALDYEDEDVFWAHEFSLHPDNPFVLSHLSALAARRGEIEQAYELSRKQLSRGSWRYRNLSSPKARARWYLRALSQHAVLTADGNVKVLEQILHELDAFLRARPGDMTGRVGELELGAKVPKSTVDWLEGHAMYPLAADAAMIATRLGHDARAREFSARIPDEQLWRTENPLNLILTRARLGDFERARANLAVVSDPPPGIRGFEPQTLKELGARLDRAENKLKQAERSAPDEATMLRAAAMADLGAYLRGLRTLRPLYDAKPELPGVAPLYVQLLVAARLKREAVEEATRGLGKERGPAVVEQIDAQLPERTRRMWAAKERSEWWPAQ